VVELRARSGREQGEEENALVSTAEQRE
jgi:hypothetical protein